jgi:hypothetical protein
MAKLNVMNSHTGRRPANAAPTAMPQNPASVIAGWGLAGSAAFASRARSDGERTGIDDALLAELVEQAFCDLGQGAD